MVFCSKKYFCRATFCRATFFSSRMGFGNTLDTLKTGLATNLEAFYEFLFKITPQMALINC